MTLFPASFLTEAPLDPDQGDLEVEVSEEVPTKSLVVEIEIEEENQEVEVLVHIEGTYTAEVAHRLQEGGEMEVFHIKEDHIQEATHRIIEDVAAEVLLLMAEEEGSLPVEDLLLEVLLLIEGLTVGVCRHIEDFREVFHHLTAKDFHVDLIAKVQAIGDLTEVKISHHPGEEDILDHTVEVFLLK